MDLLVLVKRPRGDVYCVVFAELGVGRGLQGRLMYLKSVEMGAEDQRYKYA